MAKRGSIRCDEHGHSVDDSYDGRHGGRGSAVRVPIVSKGGRTHYVDPHQAVRAWAEAQGLTMEQAIALHEAGKL